MSEKQNNKNIPTNKPPELPLQPGIHTPFGIAPTGRLQNGFTGRRSNPKPMSPVKPPKPSAPPNKSSE